MALPKHSIEDQEALLDMLEHPGFEPLMKELNALKESQAEAVLQCDLSSSSDSELVKRKCRLEGAHKLLVDLQRRLATLKPKQKAKG